MNIATCKHYNGTYFNTECEAGVKYEDVTVNPEERNGIAFRKPCTNWVLWERLERNRRVTQDDPERIQLYKDGWNACKDLCVKREVPTEEEVEQWEKERVVRLNQTLDKIANGICPKCDRKMTKKQVGSCVYANPCGHRLYQGRV